MRSKLALLLTLLQVPTPAALTFSATATDKVTITDGPGTLLDNMTVGTICSWANPTAVTVGRRIYQKGVIATDSTTVNFSIRDTASGDLSFFYSRATTSLNVRSNASLVTASAWQYLCVVWDEAGASTDQILYRGTLTAAATAPGSYAAQVVGSGSHPTDAAANAVVGNKANDSNPMIGSMSTIQIWNRRLSASEIIASQFRPRMSSGCVMFMRLGFNGTGTQVDLSGNGNTGAVTGATVGDEVPLGSYFGFDWRDYTRRILGIYA